MKHNIYGMTTPALAGARSRRADDQARFGGKTTRLAKMAFAGAFLLACSTALAAAETQQAAAEPSSSGRAIGLGLLGVSVGVSILGAGHAVGRIGSAAMGAISEKPEMLPKAFLFVALGEGLAILGFAVAMLLWRSM